MTSQWKSDQIFYSNLNKIVKVASPENHLSHGTGVLLRTATNKLVVLTNRHVCDDFNPVVYLENKTINGIGQVLYVDLPADLCLISPPAEFTATPTKLAASEPDANQEVYSMGYPLYHDINLIAGRVIGETKIPVMNTYSTQLNCKEIVNRNDQFYCITEENLVATNAFLFPGGSGSPVFNSNNELVGLMAVTATGSNFGHMVYLNDIKRVLSLY